MDDTAHTFETNSISVRDFPPNKLNLSLFGAWRTDRLLSGEKRGPGSIPFNTKCHARWGDKIIGSQASSSLFSCLIPLSPCGYRSHTAALRTIMLGMQRTQTKEINRSISYFRAGIMQYIFRRTLSTPALLPSAAV